MTISRIEKEAHVPRGALRRHFAGVRECFAGAYEMVCGEMLARGLARTREAKTCASAEMQATVELAGQLAARPELGRIAFCELLAAGAAGVRAQTSLIETFATALARQLPPAERPPHVVLSASTAAVWGIAGHLACGGRLRWLLTHRQTIECLTPSALDWATGSAAIANREPNGR